MQKQKKMLRAKGFDVFNPTTSGLGQRAELAAEHRYGVFALTPDKWKQQKKRTFYDCILLLDLEQLSWCDAIYMLSDWTKSPGANVELDFAVATGKKRFWELEDDAKVFCDDAGNYIDVWLPIDE